MFSQTQLNLIYKLRNHQVNDESSDEITIIHCNPSILQSLKFSTAFT